MANIIIAGVDGSETATLAAQRAAEAAEAYGGSLHIVSAYGPGEQRTLSDGVEKVVINLREDAERTSAEAAEALRSQFPSLEVTTSVVSGSPADGLVSEADRLEARLIVVGNRRVQGPARILGSIARTVAANASCDVYVANTRQNQHLP